jgi:hypothetical protein
MVNKQTKQFHPRKFRKEPEATAEQNDYEIQAPTAGSRKKTFTRLMETGPRAQLELLS